MKLSIIIPCYNEEKTLEKILQKIEAEAKDIDKEIILVDDHSSDSSTEIIKTLSQNKNYKAAFHKQNKGKGAAIRTGLTLVNGDIVIIQDADLEYDPADYKNLIEPILSKEAQVVYGSRERNKNNKTHSGLSFYLGGLFLTKLTNFLYGSSLTDEATCYKVFESEIIKSLDLKCQRFEFCPEVTAKILKRKIKIYEVPISYYPRKVHEGKKIKFRDGLEAIFTLLKYRLVK